MSAKPYYVINIYDDGKMLIARNYQNRVFWASEHLNFPYGTSQLLTIEKNLYPHLAKCCDGGRWYGTFKV